MNHCLRIFMSPAVFVAVLPVVQAADDGGTTWEVIGPVNDGKAIGAIQPSILDLGGVGQACRKIASAPKSPTAVRPQAG